MKLKLFGTWKKCPNSPMFKNFCVCSCCDDAGVGCGGTVAVAAVLKTAAGVALLGSVADGRL